MRPGLEWLTDGRQRNAEVLDVIRRHLPPRLSSTTRLKWKRGGWLTIRIPGIDPHYKGLVEGLLMGRNLVGTYLSDCGPQDCYCPEIHWES